MAFDKNFTAFPFLLLSILMFCLYFNTQHPFLVSHISAPLFPEHGEYVDYSFGAINPYRNLVSNTENLISELDPKDILVNVLQDATYEKNFERVNTTVVQELQSLQVKKLCQEIENIPWIDEKYSTAHLKLLDTLHQYSQVHPTNKDFEETKHFDFLIRASIDNFQVVKANFYGNNLAEIVENVENFLPSQSGTTFTFNRSPNNEMTGNVKLFDNFFTANPHFQNDLYYTILFYDIRQALTNPQTSKEWRFFWIAYCADLDEISSVPVLSKMYSALIISHKVNKEKIFDWLGESNYLKIIKELEGLIKKDSNMLKKKEIK